MRREYNSIEKPAYINELKKLGYTATEYTRSKGASAFSFPFTALNKSDDLNLEMEVRLYGFEADFLGALVSTGYTAFTFATSSIDGFYMYVYNKFALLTYNEGEKTQISYINGYISSSFDKPSYFPVVTDGRNYSRMGVFGIYNNSVLYPYKAMCDFYRLSLYRKNGTHLNDFYPVIRDSDKKVGMYDKVNYIFYQSQTNTPFTAGPQL